MDFSRRVVELTLAVAGQFQSSSVRATQVELSIWVFVVFLSVVAYLRALPEKKVPPGLNRRPLELR
jgi:hypothetical protein